MQSEQTAGTIVSKVGSCKYLINPIKRVTHDQNNGCYVKSVT